MKLHIKSQALIIFGSVFLLLNVLSSFASAQSTNAGSGLKISPVRTDLTIEPGKSDSVVITVNNVTSVDTTYDAIVNDFVAGNDELGQPALILDADKFAPSHSLKRYIRAIPSLSVPAGASKQVTATISIPKDAAAGGYYGAVRFVPASSGVSEKNITLSASVGTLILVKVPGDINENMKLESFDVRSGKEDSKASSFFTGSKDLYAVARFKNLGSIHEQPFGKVILKKGDKVLQTTEINNTDPKGNVLPDSIRRFKVKLDKVGVWGKYTVEGNFGYGSTGQLITGKTSFFVFPLAFIVGIVILLAILVGMIFGLPRAIKRYNAGVLRRAGRR